jgi:hypothetical protein
MDVYKGSAHVSMCLSASLPWEEEEDTRTSAEPD